MRPCTECIASGITCLASRVSPKCAECVRRAVSCDLVVSDEDWEKLDNERARIRGELEKCRARIAQDLLEVSRLEELQEKIKKKAGEMVAREIHNIEELELDELLSSNSLEPFDPELASSGILNFSFETPGASQHNESSS